ncbi:phage tail tube protein [Mesoterricola sediminis]|uniref:Tail protein n=1 Tax=Mesoterricola sediminis TaxID=2927980 RepID=A0AA48GRL9_9BACT|nr:phage tail tube protein [Mesoterricola sediminis]BDU76302.1 hypothetical protein METESE_12600 [Mesoterricola sediminis]
MAVENANSTQLAYIQEGQFGVTPSTPTGQLIRWTDLSLGPDRDYIDNPEYRTDGQTAAGRGGAIRGKGSFGGKVSYGTLDDFLAAALGNFGWSSNVIKIKGTSVMSAASVAVAASGKTFTRLAGSFLTDGFAVGDYVTWSGFTNSANNITVQITTLTATVMTCSNAAGLVDEGTATGRSCVTNTRPSFTFEKGHRNNGLYFGYTGCVVDGFELKGAVDSAVEYGIDLLAKAALDEARASLFSALTAVNTNPLLTTWEGGAKKGGNSISLTSWSMKVARNSDSGKVCGSSALYDISPRAAKVTGSLELYFDQNAYGLYTDMRADNDAALQFILGSGTAKSYQVDLTKCKLKNWKGDPREGMGLVSVDYESYAPDSGTNTACMITRIP